MQTQKSIAQKLMFLYYNYSDILYKKPVLGGKYKPRIKLKLQFDLFTDSTRVYVLSVLLNKTFPSFH